jgi:hypothetical protein
MTRREYEIANGFAPAEDYEMGEYERAEAMDEDSNEREDIKTMQTETTTHRTDDSTMYAVSFQPSQIRSRILVRYPDCDATDEVLLVSVSVKTPDAQVEAFQWVFAGNPAIPASDPFQTEALAWEFASQAWEQQPKDDSTEMIAVLCDIILALDAMIAEEDAIQ